MKVMKKPFVLSTKVLTGCAHFHTAKVDRPLRRAMPKIEAALAGHLFNIEQGTARST
jgi:hypothetical protein